MALLNHRFLFEADDDNAAQNDAGGDTATNTGNDAGGGDDNGDAGADDATDNADDANADDNTEDDAGDDDFSVDTDFDDTDTTGGDNNDTDTTDDTTSSSSDDSSDDDQPTVDEDSLKAKDKELFDSLSPQEQQAKNKYLKSLFVDLYSTCDNIIDKINNISGELENLSEELKRVSYVLYDLKKMISSYLLNIYDSKSYIENDIMWNRYLAVLNSVKNIVSDVAKTTEK